MSRRNNSVNITNSTLHNSAVAGRDAVHGGTGEQRAADLATLRAALAEAGKEIAERSAGGADAGAAADAAYEARKMEQELRAEEPDGETVRFRWKSVLAALDGVVAAGGRIAQVSDLVHKLFGG
jgi:hypothetical protein